jgi:5-methyltetrahydropteroyltriglutamate--homocysteine methyltransferase
MAEIDMWKDVGVDREVACGVVDVKSFYMETPDDMAERVRLCLASIPPNGSRSCPTVASFPCARRRFRELKRLAAGARLVRTRLTG